MDWPEASIRIAFWIDGMPAGETVANFFRPDVNQYYGITGDHGYSWQIPARFVDGRPHTLNVYAINYPDINSNPEIYGSPRSFVINP